MSHSKLVVTVLLTSVAAFGCASSESRESDLGAMAAAALSQIDGEIELAGLTAEVEVLRDRWGVPHIYARNTDDLFFAQGFVAAQDRLWQLELWRLWMEGRSAEVAGADRFEADRIMRLLAWRGGLTEEELNQFYAPDGFFKTGDVFHRRADGRYEFVTRIKDLIKVGGENVAAAEIERVLEEHPKIFNLQVVGVVDDRRGEVPAVFIELQPGAEAFTLDELRRWASAKMAPFKVPRRLKLMRTEEWPRTSSGKIERFQLSALLS